MEQPLISVIVPVYNVEGYVQPCLDALLAQTWLKLELVLIDDASTDGSGGVCEACAARDSRVRVVRFPENRGLSAARNEGVSRASGAYIVFVDSDDYVEPELLKTLYRALAEGRGDINVCGGEGLGLRAGPARVLSPEEAARCLARRTRFLWTVWGKLFPAELVKGIPFDRQAFCCEDLLFFYQILRRAGRIAYVPDPLYHYVYREGSLVNNGVTSQRCTVLSVLDGICEDAAVCFPEGEACFRQVALDTAARLAMQAVESGAEGGLEDCLQRFRADIRRHFRWSAWGLCPDLKSGAAELALLAGVPAFKGLAAAYRLVKRLRQKGRG